MLDLTSVSLNFGALILTTQPAAGSDSTDGMIAIQPALRNISRESDMSTTSASLNSTGNMSREVGGWIDDSDASDPFPTSPLNRLKGLSHSKGSVVPRAAADAAPGTHQIQWDRRVADTSIKRTPIVDWLILN